jgi:branched-chain amino acid transport system permease protein
VTTFLQLVLNGLVIGVLYALVALGFVLIYKCSSAINFAQGELVMMGGYMAVTMVLSYNIPFPIAVIIAVALSIVLGMLIERGVLRPLVGQPLTSIVMVTIGLGAVLRGVAPALWGAETRAFPEYFPKETVNIFGLPVTQVNLYAMGIALVFVVIFALFFRFTRIGIAMQAVADDQQASLSMGISVKQIFAWSWAIAAVVAAVGGVMWGNVLGVDLFLASVGLKVFPVVILGGLDSVVGAIIGGLIVGVVENLGGGYIDPLVGGGAKDLIPYVVLILILMVKPYGLFGKKIIERV